MRIVGGSRKNRRVTFPKHFNIRPTTDFAKEALFNILNNRVNYNELEIIDLFSGSGSISYEFLSRGAKYIYLVEKELEYADFIEEKLIELEFNLNAKVFNKDVLEFLDKFDKKADLIFADPPFEDSEEMYKCYIESAVKCLRDKDSYLIMEHSSRMDISRIIKEELKYNEIETRKYGHVQFTWIQK